MDTKVEVRRRVMMRERVRISLGGLRELPEAVAFATRLLVHRGAVEAGEPVQLAEAQPREPGG
jgi:hypothetical protein